MVSESAHVLDGPMIEEIPHPFTGSNAPEFLAQPNVVGEVLLEFMPLGVAMRSIRWPFGGRMSLSLIQQVRHPGRNRLNQHLCPFALEEVEHVEVAVAFRQLGP